MVVLRRSAAMEENKSLKLSFDVVGGDFERAGEASAKIKKMLKLK